MKWIIILMIIGAIALAVENVAAKIKVAVNKNSNPEKAVEAVEDAYDNDAMTLNGYEAQLIEIAESSKSPEIMRKLVEFYTKEKKDKQKAQYWSQRAIECGDIETILDFYGFSDYDVSSGNYGEILTVLNSIKTTSDEQLFTVDYCKGIVYYKTGRIDAAKIIFESCKKIIVRSQTLSTDASFKNNCNYLTFLCYLEEGNIGEAHSILTVLENNGFEVPAKDYLYIYNYYLGKRSSGKPVYVMEVTYAELYAACKDADQEKANQIAGDSYYRNAVAYEKGIDGYEKDEKGAMLCYEQAARFEHIEALYYVGTHCWVADNHDRDYFKANDCLRKASLKGHLKAKEFLSQYGVDEILVFPVRAETTTYTFMNGYQLTASADTIKRMHLVSGILYSLDRIAKNFLSIYSNNLKSFDDLIANIHQLYADHMAMMLQWCIRLLMRFDIDSYSAQDIIEMCGDLSLLPRVPLFEQGISDIDNRAEQLNLQTAYSHLLTTTWGGVGFGTTIGETIKAGIGASIAAGVMNIGSGILQGIGDSIVSSINNSEIKTMEKKLFEKKNTRIEFYAAVRSACLEIGTATLHIIEEQRNIEPHSMNGSIQFENENLSGIDEKTLNAKIMNNTIAKKHDYVYALLVEKLRRNPEDSETLKMIFAYIAVRQTPGDKDFDMISRYAGDFMVDLSEVAADIKSAGAKAVSGQS